MLEYQPFPGKEAKHIFALYFYILVLLCNKFEEIWIYTPLKSTATRGQVLTFCNQSDITLVIICDVLKKCRSCNKLKIFKWLVICYPQTQTILQQCSPEGGLRLLCTLIWIQPIRAMADKVHSYFHLTAKFDHP